MRRCLQNVDVVVNSQCSDGAFQEWLGARLMVPGGGVAQLEERYVRIVEVGGSSPLTSTNAAKRRVRRTYWSSCISGSSGSNGVANQYLLQG